MTPQEQQREFRNNLIHLTAVRWLKYAEQALSDDVEPSLLSKAPEQWVIDTAAMNGMFGIGKIVAKQIGDYAVQEIAMTLFRQPLTYPKTSQWLTRRALSK